MKTIRLISFFAALVFLAACSGKKAERLARKAINPPVAKDIPVPHVLSVGVGGGSFNLPSGTTIDVPEGAFVDEKGEVVKGRVNLSYKEYKDAVDIFYSGIPMEYDSAGKEEVLQTAGMFEMYGKDSTGKDVFIHPEKQLNITMKSSQLEENYNFYRYDTTANNWVYSGKSVIKKEQDSVSVNTSGIPPAPMSPQKYDPEKFVVDMKINTREFPEFSSLKGLMWQYAGDKESENPEKNAWIFKKRWSDVKLEVIDRSTSVFRLTLSDKSSSFQTVVTPVLSGKSYDKAMKEYQKKFDAYAAKYSDELKKANAWKEKMNFVSRTVGIKAFGTYNHDRIMGASDMIVASFASPSGEDLSEVVVYHLYGPSASVIKYTPGKYAVFRYPKGTGNCLISVSDDGKIYMFDNNDFLKLNYDQVVKEKKQTFVLKEVPESEISADMLKSMLKI